MSRIDSGVMQKQFVIQVPSLLSDVLYLSELYRSTGRKVLSFYSTG